MSRWQDSNLQPPAPNAGYCYSKIILTIRIISDTSIELSLFTGRDTYLLNGIEIKPLIHLSIFEYSPEIDAWEDEDGTMRLTIKEIISANLTA